MQGNLGRWLNEKLKVKRGQFRSVNTKYEAISSGGLFKHITHPLLLVIFHADSFKADQPISQVHGTETETDRKSGL